MKPSLVRHSTKARINAKGGSLPALATFEMLIQRKLKLFPLVTHWTLL